MEKIVFYLDLIVKEGGIALYLAILFGASLTGLMIWYKINGEQSKVKKAQRNLLDAEYFEN